MKRPLMIIMFYFLMIGIFTLQGCRHAGKGIKPIIKTFSKNIDEVKWNQVKNIDPSAFRIDAETIADTQKSFDDWSQKNLENLSDHIDKLPDLYELLMEGEPISYRNATVFIFNVTKMEIVTTYSKMDYVKSKEGKFDLAYKNSKGTSKIWYNNSQPSMETWTDNELPKNNEFDYYELIDINEHGAKFNVKTRISEEGVMLDFGYEVEAEYKSGNYQNYLNGKAIELEQTKQSKELMADYFKSWVEKSLTSEIKKQIIQEIGKNLSSDEFIRFSNNAKLFIDSNAEISDAATTTLKMTNKKIEEINSGQFVLNLNMNSYIVAL